MKNKERESGFTLIEILLVVVIIGMLVTIVTVQIGGQSEKAKLVSTRRQIDAYKTALGIYELDNGFYPSTQQGLEALISKPGGAPAPARWKGPYLDPPVLRDDPWGQSYVYRYPGEKMSHGYDLFSKGPNLLSGDDDDIGNWQ